MWAYFKFELLQFFTNKKNIAVYVILLFFALYYVLKIVPAYDPVEKVDVDEMEARYLTREEFMNTAKSNHWAVEYALSIFPEWNEHEKARIDALAEKDYVKYAEATANWYTYTDMLTYKSRDMFYTPAYYTYDNPHGHKDGHYGYLYSASRFEAYAKGDSELSLSVFEERTAIQTLQRLLNSYLPLLLFVSCIFLTVDIVLKDRRNKSTLKGFPIADWKKLFVKGVVSLFGTLCAFLPLSIGFFIIGTKSGFGDLSLPIPIYSALEESFTNSTMAEYFIKNLLFLLVWFIFLISLILLVSITVKAEFANLFVGLAIVAAEWIYFEREMGTYTDVHQYPTSYVQVGQILSGYRNFVYDSESFTVENGILLVGACAIVIIVLTFIISHFKKFKLIS